jgi:hypothetical protein
MALLFRQRGEGEIKIAAEVVKAAAGNTESEKDAMASLPQQQGTRGVQKVMEPLLERCRDEAMITQEVVKEAACNPHGKGTLEFLLEKDPALPITADVVRAAACSQAGKETVELFLNVRSCMSSDRQPKTNCGAVSWGELHSVSTLKAFRS